MNEPMTLPQDRMWPQSTWLNNRLPQPNHSRHIVPLIRLRWQSLMTCGCWRVDCMLWDGIYHSACHVGRGEGSKGDSGTKGVIHTTSGQGVRSGIEGVCLPDKRISQDNRG